MEKEIRQLREIVLSVLPPNYRLDDVDVTFGSLTEGQPPSFKALINVTFLDPGRLEPGGWGYELSKRVRELWTPDELYIAVHTSYVERPSSDGS